MPPVEDCMEKSSLLSSWVQQGQTNLTWTKSYPGWRSVKHRTPPPATINDNNMVQVESNLPKDNFINLKCENKDPCDMKGLEDALSFPSTKNMPRDVHHPFRSSITNIDYFLNRSLSELIQHCLGCGDLAGEAEDAAADLDPMDLPALHQECAQPNPSLEQIRTLLHEDGCDPNQILAGSGRSPLHTLLLTPHGNAADGVDLVACAAALVEAGAHLDLRDATGSTPLNSLEYILSQGLVRETAAMCELFLSSSATSSHGCDVNSMNGSGRTLLSHSVTYLDLAAEVTRVLVNHGGRVWPNESPTSPASVESLTQDREQSAFTWFLRTLIQTNNLAGAESTLNSLSHEMGRDPARMKSHVMRVMLAEGKHPKVLGPLYLKLKLAMCPFWDEPQHLRYLAWNSIRRSIGPKRLATSSKQLGLPLPLRKYLTLSSSRPASSRSVPARK